MTKILQHINCLIRIFLSFFPIEYGKNGTFVKIINAWIYKLIWPDFGITSSINMYSQRYWETCSCCWHYNRPLTLCQIWGFCQPSLVIRNYPPKKKAQTTVKTIVDPVNTLIMQSHLDVVAAKAHSINWSGESSIIVCRPWTFLVAWLPPLLLPSLSLFIERPMPETRAKIFVSLRKIIVALVLRSHFHTTCSFMCQ